MLPPNQHGSQTTWSDLRGEDVYHLLDHGRPIYGCKIWMLTYQQSPSHEKSIREKKLDVVSADDRGLSLWKTCSKLSTKASDSVRHKPTTTPTDKQMSTSVFALR